jgi:hypothetical protein
MVTEKAVAPPPAGVEAAAPRRRAAAAAAASRAYLAQLLHPKRIRYRWQA